MKTQEGIRLLNSYYNWCTDFPFLIFYLITLFPPLYANAIAAAKTPEELCPPGWEINPNKTKCYFHISIPHSWDQSQSICNNLHHSHLAAPSSSQDLILLRNLCNRHSNGSKTPRSHSNACWLGGRASNSSNSSSGFTWNWFGSDDLSQSNFTISTIDNSNHTDHCTLVMHNSSALLAERCNASHEFLCMLHIEDRCHRHHCHKEYFFILLSVSGLILGTTLAVVIWLLAYKRSKRRKRSRKASNPSTSALVPSSWKVFTNEELRSVTKNFSEGNRLIGDAKTGGTYSGVLPDGSRVAVKRLKRSTYQRKKEFYSAIGKVARLHHPNLVAIKGCRFDHGDRFIVYEFVANGPLDRWLHHIPRGGRSLDWSMRMRVATTLAQGIAFLHDKVKPHVVHHDIRASNVLLDEDFGAHLMGVGLSKFVPWEVMHERTKMAATYGYLAPEFVYRNELTTKSDVYSFGVLLLEIVSGRRPTQSVDSVGGWQTIFEWATPLVQSHCYLDLLDPLISDLPEVGVIQKVVELVYCCTQHVPSVRPRMSHVVHQLQQLGMKAASDKTKVGPSSETSTSTTTPVSVLEVEVSN